MPRITIDNKVITVPDGATILEAAAQAGIAIPTLCHLAGHPAQTSCFVCVVKVNGGSRLLPSCATAAADGMVVESETPEVRAARRTALELLLGDHLGDCIGPCQGICPAHMDIPGMIRLIAAGRPREALALVKERIPLPATLGRICPELCERGCRRALHDSPLSICLLKRFVADADLASGAPYRPLCQPASGKRVAIIGAGPAGLSAAYYLLQAGHACVLFDARERPGGMLRTLGEDRLPADVLDAEIALIRALGAEFRPDVRIGAEVTLEELRRTYDAVLVAAGEAEGAFLGLDTCEHGVCADRETLQTPLPGVFAAGSVVAPTHHAVRAVADGRVAAVSIAQYLAGEQVTGGGRRPFSTHMGRLQPHELRLQLEDASPVSRHGPAGHGGYTLDEARAESERCLHCDCRGLRACKLREHSIAYGAETGRFRGERRTFTRDASHPEVIYEPGKCIDCGLCVRITEAAREPLGLSFIGRGFDVRPAVPFGESLADGLRTAAAECVAACPTGALAWKRDAEATGE